jgi:hypothetical protein
MSSVTGGRTPVIQLQIHSASGATRLLDGSEVQSGVVDETAINQHELESSMRPMDHLSSRGSEEGDVVQIKRYV